MCLSSSQHLSEFLGEIDVELSSILSQPTSPMTASTMLKSI